MSEFEEQQSLESKIIKILRITNEPISPHALSEIYFLNYSKVRDLLKSMAKDGIVYELRTSRGNFYFIPDKYFKREKDMLQSEKKLPFVWYEELTSKELTERKKTIQKSIEKINNEYSKQKITATDYFKTLQEKNEELFIIDQIIEDRKKKKIKRCFYCKEVIPIDKSVCPFCEKKMPICSVCKRKIYFKDETALCPNCKARAHKNHIQEWLKSLGTCPKCQKHLLEQELLLEEEIEG